MRNSSQIKGQTGLTFRNCVQCMDWHNLLRHERWHSFHYPQQYPAECRRRGAFIMENWYSIGRDQTDVNSKVDVENSDDDNSKLALTWVSFLHSRIRATYSQTARRCQLSSALTESPKGTCRSNSSWCDIPYILFRKSVSRVLFGISTLSPKAPCCLGSQCLIRLQGLLWQH